MIKSKEDYKRYVKEDRNIYFNSYSNITYEHKLLLKYLKLYRKIEYLYNCRKDIIGKLLYKIGNRKFHRLCIKYKIFLPINTIEEGLCIVHIGDIYVNKNVKIGKYVKIQPMTTIGKSMGRNEVSPKVGDGTWIGPGARIYGNIHIGKNCVIGTNSVVNKSFPDNVTIAGIPAKIISKKGYKDYFK